MSGCLILNVNGKPGNPPTPKGSTRVWLCNGEALRAPTADPNLI